MFDAVRICREKGKRKEEGKDFGHDIVASRDHRVNHRRRGAPVRKGGQIDKRRREAVGDVKRNRNGGQISKQPHYNVKRGSHSDIVANRGNLRD